MTTTAKIRDLRNHFREIRKVLESEGEVILTEKGRPLYRLSLCSPEQAQERTPVDYWARLQAYQPEPITADQARALAEHNRGER